MTEEIHQSRPQSMPKSMPPLPKFPPIPGSSKALFNPNTEDGDKVLGDRANDQVAVASKTEEVHDNGNNEESKKRRDVVGKIE